MATIIRIIFMGREVTYILVYIMLVLSYSTVDPPHTAALGTDEKAAVLENGGKGRHI